MITVIIPAKVHGHCINEAIQSALDQVVPVDRIIVALDGPTRDDFETYYASLPDSVEWTLFDESHGVAAARNWLFRAARHGWVIPLDEDDILHPTYVARMLQAVGVCPDVKIFYPDWIEFGPQVKQPYRKTPEFSLEQLQQGPFIISSSFIHHSAWKAVRDANGTGYDQGLEKCGLRWEDYLFYLEAAHIGIDMARVGFGLVRVRKHPNTGTEIANATIEQWHKYATRKLMRYMT